MPRIIAVLLLVLLIGPAGAVQIVEFCPDPYRPGDPDEYLVLEGSGTLNGLVVTDGEGGFRFPAGTGIDGRVVVARNSRAFAQTHGVLPDFELYDHSPAVPDVIRSGDLAMANAGDELILYRGTTVLQQVAWPADVRPREGQIHYLEDGVWDPRPLLIGQSRMQPATFDGVAVTAFVAPDCSFEVFSSAVASAEREILVNVYEFTDVSMAHELVQARERGVAVTVLLEGGPVGGVSSEEKHVAGFLNASGIVVLQMTTTDAAHAKYRYDHAKYMVIDGERVLIGSENYKPNGFPPAGAQGNRGWGAYLDDPELAAYFTDVFRWDAGGGDIVPLAGELRDRNPPEEDPPYTVEFSPFRAEGARVTPVLAPDTSHLVTRLLAGASESILIEQAYIRNETAFELNPFLAAAIDASRRGVEVKVLLDAAWFNTEGDADNDEMVEVINRLARGEGLPLEARLADLAANDLEKIHNKGVVVDTRAVLISSINWNANSPNFNREAGVIIEHPDVAAYYAAVFMDDWEAAPAEGARAQGAEETDYVKIAAAVCIMAALAVLYRIRHRR